MKPSSAKAKCTKCLRSKGVHLFNRQAKSPTGRNPQCKACQRKYLTEWHQKAKDEEWVKYKSQQLRSNWRQRCDGVLKEDVPSAPVIAQWMRDSMPWTCAYTGEPLTRENMGFDHATPISKGGDMGVDNLVMCLKTMNSCKGDMDFAEFMDLLTTVWSWPDRGESILRRLRLSGGMFRGSSLGFRQGGRR